MNRKLPSQVCYWGGYCDESSNPNSGKKKRKEEQSQRDRLKGVCNQTGFLLVLNESQSLKAISQEIPFYFQLS